MPKPKTEWVSIKYFWPSGKSQTIKVDPALVWVLARVLAAQPNLYDVSVESTERGTFMVSHTGWIYTIRSTDFDGSYDPQSQPAL